MNEENQIANRVSWIDAFKGLAILLVVWSHCRTDEINYAARFPWGCHMPAFFFIAGVTLNVRCSWRDFLVKRIATILWPLAVASIAYWWFMPNSRGQILIDTLTFDGSGPLWFLSAYFIAIHLARLAAILSRKRLVVGFFVVIGISLFFVAGRIPDLIHANRVYVVYRALLAAVFIYCGWLARDFVKNIDIAYLCLPALGYLAMVKFMKSYFVFDLHYATIPNAFAYLSLAICGISLRVVLSRMLDRLPWGGGGGISGWAEQSVSHDRPLDSFLLLSGGRRRTALVSDTKALGFLFHRIPMVDRSDAGCQAILSMGVED